MVHFYVLEYFIIVETVKFHFRYLSVVSKLKELVKEHNGEVLSLNIIYNGSYATNSAFHRLLNTQTGLGIIMEVSTHWIDLARFIAGDVIEETIHTIQVKDTDPGGIGKLRNLPEGGEDDIDPDKRVPRVTSSHWKFKSGGIGTLLTNITAPGPKTESFIDVYMDGLQMSLVNVGDEDCVLKVKKIGCSEIVYSFKDHDPYLSEMKSFLKAVHSRDTSFILSSYTDAKKTFEQTWAIRRSEEKIQAGKMK